MVLEEPVLDWFVSYLSDRYQTVQIGTFYSNLKLIEYGVSQGSILGPLLFFVYVNDMHTSINTGSFKLFTDDTCVIYQVKNIKKPDQSSRK